ncbi:MAG: murein biosynthesis integral membrane protein MurJ [Phycisphaerae bacterium]
MSEHTRFVAPARIIAALTAGSRVLGLVREAAYSFFFGIHPALSSFRIAFMVPNLARRLFGEGAMASAFVPVFTDVLQKQGNARARELAGTAFGFLGACLIALTILVQAGVGLAYLAAPSDTLLLTLVMMPYMVMICLAGFAGGMLNALNRFAVPAAAPILLNLVLISALGVGGWVIGLNMRPLIYLVAAGVLLAGLLQFASQVVEMRRAGCSPRLNFRWKDPDLRRILALLGPMVIGLSAMQLNVLADNLIALFFVPDGRGPAVLGYAHMLYHLPQGIFGIALATAIFPLLSVQAARKDHAGLAQAFQSGIRVSLFIALPASIGLIMLAHPIVALVYQHRGGQFDQTATGHVARTLTYYCLGLWAFSIQPILARAFYALQDTKTPVRISLITVALNLALSIILVFPLQEAGIALATAITAALQALWLSLALYRRLPQVHWPTVLQAALKTAAATAAMAVFLYWAHTTPSLANRSEAVQLAVAIPGGVAIFAITARVLRCAEIKELVSRADR